MALQVFGGGHAQLGPELRVEASPLFLRLRPFARAGFAWAREVSAPDGAAQSTAITGGVGLLYAFPRVGRGSAFRLGAGLDAYRVAAHGAARADTVAYEGSTWGAAAVLGAGASLPITRASAVAFGLDGGAVVRPVSLTDGRVEVSALSGWTLRATVGIALGR
jgi:hypothetical protein